MVDSARADTANRVPQRLVLHRTALNCAASCAAATANAAESCKPMLRLHAYLPLGARAAKPLLVSPPAKSHLTTCPSCLLLFQVVAVPGGSESSISPGGPFRRSSTRL